MTIHFEGYDRRIDGINESLSKFGFSNLEEALNICMEAGIDVDKIVKGIQGIAFDNAVWYIHLVLQSL